ncbi:hypothetical protein FRAHR75_140058 [Frankia sp. Hr75.2]|nr:hypothetical protein FRAHR75_140058 [Frankia sp. Hr75.2]
MPAATGVTIASRRARRTGGGILRADGGRDGIAGAMIFNAGSSVRTRRVVVPTVRSDCHA